MRPTAVRIAAYDYVLLGEVHDNVQHHADRAELLRALLADGRPTVVLFEMMGRTHDATLVPAVERVRRTGFATPMLLAAAADEVAAAGGLDRRGWGWPLHRPVVEAALAGGAAVRGANLEASEARA
ncbi:MAG: ChaN family lipoprotein, partial [Ideonella sp.]|nr:ChaN family lipoprotein [Ideonella sp.]